ncbi:MAG: trypsin-like peptidase domain-containing protein [Anaerolineae bacterium]|nr:trypsin-like peptidase domain-containing protein [Anaerolineae bacterium]
MKKWFSKNQLIVSILLLVALVALAGGAPILAANPATLPATEDALSQDTPLPGSTIFTEVYERVSPSVVSINVVARRPDSGVFGQDNTVIGAGTGFVIDTEGHIVTNNHVVDGATRIEVNFFDGTLTRAEVLGLDPDSDLAVLKVDLPAAKLHPVEFGDSDALVIGQTVLAIGSPFGQRWTLTSGIVSALNRTISGMTNFSIGGVIQTDASINPGNSGGPLLDLEGRVIGVNSQIISAGGSSAGVGFAIPSNLARRVAQELIENGYVDYSYLGITGGDVTLAIIEAFDLPNDLRGVVVSEVTPGGAAARAGLHDMGEIVKEDDQETGVPNSVDIITAIDGEPLYGIADLVTYLANHTTPGQTVTLTVLRDGKETLELEAKLMPRP